METKRLAMALVLSAVVLIVWSVLFPPPKPTRPSTATNQPPAAATAAPTAAASPTAQQGTAPAPAEAAASTVEPIAAAAEETVSVTTQLYAAKLSNRGGDLVSLALTKHRDGAGQPLDLVRKGNGFPGRTLALDPADPFLARAAAAFHQVERSDGARGETVVVFRYREADGHGLVRTYTFGAAGYVFRMAVERTGPSPTAVGVVLGPGLGNPTAEELEGKYTQPGSTVVLGPGGGVDRHAKDLKETMPLGAGQLAAGLEDNYFLTVFLPKGEAATTLRPVKVGPAATAQAESEVVLSATGTLETELFFGPKELDVLEGVRPGMGRLIDFGWYAILVKPLLFVLKMIYGWVKNWGVAIIVITIFIKLLLYPLTHKQLLSMKRMSQVQPKMEAIRVKWSTKIKQDPQARVKMNEEMMALYKTEGINPAGGCIPLLLQMPILIAFYNLLAHSIELRHAPFALWLTDLSAKDPYYVTPILMTITMWIQQQMTPATGDPMQRKIFAIMPFVFGFFFKDVPSGLVLYWLVQNVLTIVQQMILNKYTDLGPASMAKKPA